MKTTLVNLERPKNKYYYIILSLWVTVVDTCLLSSLLITTFIITTYELPHYVNYIENVIVYVQEAVEGKDVVNTSNEVITAKILNELYVINFLLRLSTLIILFAPTFIVLRLTRYFGFIQLHTSKSNKRKPIIKAEYGSRK